MTTTTTPPANVPHQVAWTNLGRQQGPSTTATAASTTTQQTNQQRAANLLQLGNTTFRINNNNLRLQVSDHVRDRLRVKTYMQKSKAPGFMINDNGTNISVSPGNARVVSLSGRYADMSAFADDLCKTDIPIGDTVFRVNLPGNQGPILVGLRESGILENNEYGLISTGQAREFGTWIDDVMRRHGGEQRIIGELTYDGEPAGLRQIDLEQRQGLLGFEIHYPSDEDMRTLPIMWLTGNETPWDPSVLDTNDVEVLSCFDPETSVLGANHATVRELDDMSAFARRVARQADVSQGLLYLTGLTFLCNTLHAVYRTLFPQPAGSNIVLDINNMQLTIKDPDFEWYRPRLGWMPLDVVKRTFDATTQLVSKVPLRFPMRRHVSSRFPKLNRPRLAETFAMDTLFSSEKALGGITCAQLYTGTTSMYTVVHGMKSENEVPDSVEDFVRDVGAPYAIRSDNSKVQTGLKVLDIYRKYGIASENTEPGNQQQNPAERKIQDVKKHTTKIMDRTNAPIILWFLCMLYVVILLNHVATAGLNWRTPYEACFGRTPDISKLLQFQFYEPVYYSTTDSAFPSTQESRGHWVGIAENKGDALTWWILTENNTLIARSVVRSALNTTEPNLRTPAKPPSDSTSPPTVQGRNGSDAIRFDLLSDIVNDKSPTPTPTFDPTDVVGFSFVRADNRSVPTKTTVTEVDEDTGKVLLEYVHGGLEWVEPNIIQEAMISRKDDGADLWTFTKILDHRTDAHGKMMVEVLWDNNETSWEPLANVRKDDPVTLAAYARDKNLLQQRGWKWARSITKNEKKYVRMLKLMMGQKKQRKKYKFGVEVPRTVKRALELDRLNGNNKWKEAMDSEVRSLLDMETFRKPGSAEKLSEYTNVRLLWCFDVKFDGRRKARVVVNGSVLERHDETETYSGVVSTESVRLAMFLAKLNGLKICAADISTAYLNAESPEKLKTKLGFEFGPDWSGQEVIIHKALYGALLSCHAFHKHCASQLYDLGFVPSKADSDLWMRDAGDHYEYIAVFIDDLLVCSKDPLAILNKLQKPHGPYALKGVGSPTYYLGGDVHIRYVNDVMEYLATSAKTYIKRVTEKIESLMEWTLRNHHSPENPDYHPELDESPLLEGDNISRYRMMVGSLNWCVTLGRYDVHHAANTLARYMMLPREGHLNAMQRVFGYLKAHMKWSIKFDEELPDFSVYDVQQYDWFEYYGNVTEEMPYGMPVPKGKIVRTAGFFDADHAGCLVTRRSTTSVLLFVNKTPVVWYSKRQNTIETSTYGSEVVAGRIATDLAVELRYKLRMLGAPVDGATVLFGDNKSMVTSVSKPNSILKKRHNLNAYHRVREAVAASIVNIVHCGTKWNLADMGSKAVTRVVHQHLLHNQVFPPPSDLREYQLEMAKQDQTIVDSAQRLTSATVNAFSPVLPHDTTDVIGNSNVDDDLVHVVHNGQFMDRVRLLCQGNAGLFEPKDSFYVIDAFSDGKNTQQADG